ncbi:DUF1624 domain-containing protein [Candidatus Synechococcus calcipolaris G9]|uniref:DUF1624 domain-containing protein n=1 Tax=Candidatus Synechococcus calcipolaris G9 TaxID=1497997 RepID=A0ABT6F2W7_9SYNE|nr:heparan-alpha-glucosaminide N-acetyltransferase domain-containing protein [Candidatus Synechococcus calcipolaris]MDG2992179.1 DUF1624 domain-containing protein [Candidatus Synechococcus calcipolaris G9]
MAHSPESQVKDAKSSQRVNCVDVMRGLALLGMVLCHYPIFLSSGEEGDRALYFVSNHLLGDFPASWFVFLVGVSVVLSSQKREISVYDVRRYLTRGGVLFAYGLLFLFLVQGPENLWIWDILTFIAAATIVLGFCRPLPSWAIIALAAVIWLVTPQVRSLTPIAPFYGGEFLPVDWISDYFPNVLFDPASDYEPTGKAVDIFVGFLYGAQFPLFPWITFPLVGLVVGRRLVGGFMAKDTPMLLGLGTLFAVAGLGKAFWAANNPPHDVVGGYLTPLSFYPLSFSMNTLLLGIILLVFTGLWHLYDSRPLESKFLRGSLAYLRQLSRYSLTIYISHFALFFIPLRLIDYFTGNDYLYDLMSTGLALGLAIVLMALYYPVLVQWDKIKGKFSFEWFLASTVALLMGKPMQKTASNNR